MAPLRSLSAAALFFSCALVVQPAGALTLSTADSPFPDSDANMGWWSNTLASSHTSRNYFLGVSSDGHDHRSFFSFDLAAVPDTVLAATLRISRGGSENTEATETIEFFDVSTDAETLNTATGASVAIFEDLGSGTSYGSFLVAGSGVFTEVLEFELNAAALADLNGELGGFLSIGARLTSSDGDDALFTQTTRIRPAELFLVVAPEPASFLLLAAGLVALRFGRRSRAPRACAHQRRRPRECG